MSFWSTLWPQTLTKARIEREKQQIVTDDGPWTAHNIPLGHGITTMGVERNYDTAKLELCIKTIAENAGKPIAALRILDLACLEGMYSIEFARFGAEVVGIEVRELNLRKARFAKKALGLRNVEFIQDDVRNISHHTYGEFDVVLMTGILYHIDQVDQLPFLKAASGMCKNLMYVDTHVALTPDREFMADGMSFTGTEWQEFAPSATLAERKKMLWASFENPKSFKLSLPSLHTALKHIGFQITEELPRIEKQPADRLVVLAKK